MSVLQAIGDHYLTLVTGGMVAFMAVLFLVSITDRERRTDA